MSGEAPEPLTAEQMVARNRRRERLSLNRYWEILGFVIGLGMCIWNLTQEYQQASIYLFGLMLMMMPSIGRSIRETE